MFTLITQLLEGIFKLIFELLSLVFTSFSKKKGYNADFATEGSLLSRWNFGFSLTGRKQITMKNSCMNALIVGTTGSGKTQVSLLSSLFSTKGSFIVHDPSCENFNKSGGRMQQQRKVKILNFSKPEISAGFNPMSRAKTSSEIQKLASMLVRASLAGGKEDPFWTSQATALLAILISILKTQAEEYQNLFNVRMLLNQLNAKSDDDDVINPVDALFSQYAGAVLYNEYKSVIALDDRLLSSIIATCKSALTIFADELVAQVTSHDTIDFSDFRKEPTVLYLQNSIADQKYYSVLTSIFFEQLTNYLLSRFPDDDEQSIFLFIDEFSSLRVPVFPLAFANVRKHRAGIMAVVQDYNQLVNAYGKADAEAIRANCFSKVFFGGGSLEGTRELEQILGKYDYLNDEGKKETRPLLTNDEIRMLKENCALLICGAHPPILARVRPAYKSRRYRAYMAIPAPITKGEGSGTVAICRLESPTTGMPKDNTHTTGLRAFLDARGLLENGTEAEILAARREYRKIYLTGYKRKQREENSEFSILLSQQKGEYGRIAAAARRHKLSIPAFLKSASFAYITKTFIVPDRDMIVKLAGLLAECLNEVQQIANGKEKNYWLIEQKYEAIEKRIGDLEGYITRLFSEPLAVEDIVRSAIEKDADLRLRLLLFLTSVPNAPQS